MSDAPGQLSLPRSSLIEQTVAALRTALRDGALANPLPGEHALAARLGISRPTLRAAFATLAREGLLTLAKGRRAQVTASHTKAPARTAPPSVCIVSPLARNTISPDEHPILLQMHARFAAKGIAWEEIFDCQLAGGRPEARLQQLVAARPNACWIMIASTEPMQRWFAASGTPALVLGSCHTNIRLPSVDINYRAVGWHAAGIMRKHGHRQLGLLIPAQPLAGDLACRGGFLAYLAQAPGTAALLEIKVGRNPQDLRPKLDRILASPDRPTAILSLLQSHTLTALLHLLETGRQIPRQVSLIARDLHPLLETAMPDLAHYSRPTNQLVSRALRLTEALLAGRSVPPEPSLITPVFMPGRTLAAAGK